MSRSVMLVCVVALSFVVPGIHSSYPYDTAKEKGIWKKCEGIPDNMCEVCYPVVGCFAMRPECGEDPKELNGCEVLPDHPADIATTFLLYDKKNRDYAVEMTTDAAYSDEMVKKMFEDNGFNPKKDTKILVHGLWGPNLYGLLEHIKEAFFDNDKKDAALAGVNLIMVNWGSGNEVGTVNPEKLKRLFRIPAVRARVVGRQLGMFMERMTNIWPDDVTYEGMHIVGHNLGAHVAGFAGKYIRDTAKGEVSRITALAPTGPYFETVSGKENDKKIMPPACRLDADDATFVEAIHGDIPSVAPAFKNTLGSKLPIGHVDVYPNDGRDPQSGCKYMYCSHGRPMEYYEQSIRRTCEREYKTKRCPSSTFPSSTPCPDEGCPIMGYGANTSARGIFCIDTDPHEPFCPLKDGEAAKEATKDGNAEGDAKKDGAAAGSGKEKGAADAQAAKENIEEGNTKLKDAIKEAQKANAEAKNTA